MNKLFTSKIHPKLYAHGKKLCTLIRAKLYTYQQTSTKTELNYAQILFRRTSTTLVTGV